MWVMGFLFWLQVYYCFPCFKMKTESVLTPALQVCLITLFLLSEMSPCRSMPLNLTNAPWAGSLCTRYPSHGIMPDDELGQGLPSTNSPSNGGTHTCSLLSLILNRMRHRTILCLPYVVHSAAGLEMRCRLTHGCMSLGTGLNLFSRQVGTYLP